MVLRPKPRNHRGDFETQITKPKLPVLRPKLGENVATRFEAKLEKTVATGFEAKPAKTIAAGLRPNRQKPSQHVLRPNR
jgi:hypothetical protein